MENSITGILQTFTTKCKPSDNRPYIWVKILDRDIVALLDSGANRSVVCSKSIQILRDLGLKLNQSKLKSISTADGEQHKIQGLVDLRININNVI